MEEKSKVSVPPVVAKGGDSDHASVELSARRTGMSFQRTRMSADRTLMSAIRTSLALISFGFTIYQFFARLRDDKIVRASHAPRNFGSALIWLGIAMIVAGITFHIQFMIGLRRQRKSMADEGLIHAQSQFPGSYTLGVALLLLLLGIAAVVSVSYNVGPLE